jgi:hypothetical protein
MAVDKRGISILVEDASRLKAAKGVLVKSDSFVFRSKSTLGPLKSCRGPDILLRLLPR